MFHIFCDRNTSYISEYPLKNCCLKFILTTEKCGRILRCIAVTQVNNSKQYLSMHPATYLPTALQTFDGPWPLFQFLDLFTQSVGLLRRGISPSQGRYLHTGQHKHRINAYTHPCLNWDSNPRSQCFSGRRQFMPQTASHCDRLFRLFTVA
jgi:hypothetical protein